MRRPNDRDVRLFPLYARAANFKVNKDIRPLMQKTISSDDHS